MKAIQINSYVKGPLELRTTILPTPVPHPEKYLIKIHACGTNFFDVLQIAGKYQHQPTMPWISGMEFAGVVIATPTTTKGQEGGSMIGSLDATITGHTSHKFKVGDRVFGAQQGAYATHILAPETSVFAIPAGWSYADAAGLYVTAPTSYGGLVVRAKTQPGEWVLVHAGAGGVGLAAIQIAKALGATVIATAGTERKRQICLNYGADHVIDYTDNNWPKRVIGLCEQHRQGNGKQGVDVVYDPVGMIDASIKCIAWNGRLLVIGFAGGAIEKVAMNRVLLKNISIVGLHWGMYAQKELSTVTETWKGIFELVYNGSFKAITFTDQKFEGLESVPRALKALSERETWGKVVVSLGEHEGEDRSRL